MAGFGFAEEIHSVCAAGHEGQFVKLCVLPLVSLWNVSSEQRTAALSRPPSVQCLEGKDPIVSRKRWEDKDRLYTYTHTHTHSHTFTQPDMCPVCISLSHTDIQTVETNEKVLCLSTHKTLIVNLVFCLRSVALMRSARVTAQIRRSLWMLRQSYTRLFLCYRLVQRFSTLESGSMNSLKCSL